MISICWRRAHDLCKLLR